MDETGYEGEEDERDVIEESEASADGGCMLFEGREEGRVMKGQIDETGYEREEDER